VTPGRDALAVVGSTHVGTAQLVVARHVIEQVLDRRRPDVIISGGAFGVDTLARVIADERGIPVIEYLPRNRRWQPYGFKERNLLIVRDCTRLLCLRSPASRTYGSGWTADVAEQEGRPVKRVML